MQLFHKPDVYRSQSKFKVGMEIVTWKWEHYTKWQDDLTREPMDWWNTDNSVPCGPLSSFCSDQTRPWSSCRIACSHIQWWESSCGQRRVNMLFFTTSTPWSPHPQSSLLPLQHLFTIGQPHLRRILSIVELRSLTQIIHWRTRPTC